MRVLALVTLLFLATTGTRAAAQSRLNTDESAPQGSVRSALGSRLTFGVAVQRAQPRGTFRSNVGSGDGLNGHLRYDIDRNGILALGVDFGGVVHNDGTTSHAVPTAFDEGAEYATVLTSSSASTVGLGVHLSYPRGPVRPHLSASYARVKLSTKSMVGGLPNRERVIFATTTSDVSYACVLGGGIDVPIGHNRLAVIDIGARYFLGAEGRWLHEGDIDRSGDEYYLRPSRDDADFFTWSLGMRFDLEQIFRKLPR